MAKKSIFARIRDAASKTAKRVTKVWQKEEKQLPPPTPESTQKQKESWIKRKFSSIREFSPWKIFKKTETTEIDAELKALREKEKELKKRKKDIQKKKAPPTKKFVDVKPITEPETFIKEPEEKKPVKPLINEPEFEMERFRMLGIMGYLREKFENFADGMPFIYQGRTLNPPTTTVDVDTSALADGSVIVQAKFSDFGEEDEFRMFTLFLESLIHSFGPGFRVSIAQLWDPSKLTIPYDIKEGRIGKKTGYDFHKGLLDIAQNVSMDVAASFETARDNLYYKLKELIGEDPDFLTVRVVWGESVIRLSRKSAKL